MHEAGQACIAGSMRCRGSGAASGNVVTNDTDADAGDSKTVTAVSFGAVNGTLGTALAGAYGSLVLNTNGAFTFTVNDNNTTVQGLRQSTDTLADVFTYTMRDTAGATSTTSLTITIRGIGAHIQEVEILRADGKLLVNSPCPRVTC